MLAQTVNQFLSAFGLRVTRVQTFQHLVTMAEKGRQWDETAGKQYQAGSMPPPPVVTADTQDLDGLEQRLNGQFLSLEHRQQVFLSQSLRHRYAYLGNNRGVTYTFDGHKIFVDTRDVGLTPHLVLNGVWERAIEQVIKRMVKPGNTVLEVGANMGYHTLAMAAVIGPQGKIHTFEANPDLVQLLKATIAINGYDDRITLLPVAASDREGTLSFAYDPLYIGGGHIMRASEQPKGGVQITVPTVTIDKQFQDLKSIDFLRMDAEGAEPLVIRGAKQLLGRSPNVKIVVEWSTLMMGAHCNLQGFVDEMSGDGFRFWRINGDETLSLVSKQDTLALPHCEVVMSRTQPDIPVT